MTHKVRAQLRRIQLRRNVGIASLASQYLPARRSRSTTGLHKVRSKTPNCMIELWWIYLPYLTRLFVDTENDVVVVIGSERVSATA